MRGAKLHKKVLPDISEKAADAETPSPGPLAANRQNYARAFSGAP